MRQIGQILAFAGGFLAAAVLVLSGLRLAAIDPLVIPFARALSDKLGGGGEKVEPDQNKLGLPASAIVLRLPNAREIDPGLGIGPLLLRSFGDVLAEPDQLQFVGNSSYSETYAAFVDELVDHYAREKGQMPAAVREAARRLADGRYENVSDPSGYVVRQMLELGIGPGHEHEHRKELNLRPEILRINILQENSSTEERSIVGRLHEDAEGFRSEVVLVSRASASVSCRKFLRGDWYFHELLALKDSTIPEIIREKYLSGRRNLKIVPYCLLIYTQPGMFIRTPYRSDWEQFPTTLESQSGGVRQTTPLSAKRNQEGIWTAVHVPPSTAVAIVYLDLSAQGAT